MQTEETIKKAEKALELINSGMHKKDAVKKAGLACSLFYTYMKRKRISGAPRAKTVKRKPVVTFPVLEMGGGTVTLTYSQLASFAKELLRA